MECPRRTYRPSDALPLVQTCPARCAQGRRVVTGGNAADIACPGPPLAPGALQKMRSVTDHALSTDEMSAQPRHHATIALLPWGNLLEDFLNTIGISLETFCNEFTGSWMFGYVDALRGVGVRTVLICISARIAAPFRCVHRPTGAAISVLPAPRLYRALQRKMVNPYGRTVRRVFGELRGARRLWFPLLALLSLGANEEWPVCAHEK